MKFFILIALMLSSEFALAKDGRLRCRANGAEGREAELRLEDGVLEAKWEIDANNNSGQTIGTRVRVNINGTEMPPIILDSIEGNELEGSYEIFRGIPVIRSGTRANIGALSCRFL
jgi:hypothetical protein